MKSLLLARGNSRSRRALYSPSSCWRSWRCCRSIRTLTGDTFVLTLFTRVLILAIGAVSLNLIMGYGGMVSFGHAAYLGIGGYAVGILGEGRHRLGLRAMAGRDRRVRALRARRRRAQPAHARRLFHHDHARLRADDLLRGDRAGPLRRRRRPHYPQAQRVRRPDRPQQQDAFYYLCFALLLASIYLVSRHGQFALRPGRSSGARSNERRMRAIGFPTFRYKLAAFVIAGALCGLAGALLANHTNFISPAMMYWTRSGDLMVMVVLGGLAHAVRPADRRRDFLLLEEALSRVTEYPGLILGPMLLLVAIYLHGGIAGLFERRAPWLSRCCRSRA